MEKPCLFWTSNGNCYHFLGVSPLQTTLKISCNRNWIWFCVNTKWTVIAGGKVTQKEARQDNSGHLLLIQKEKSTLYILEDITGHFYFIGKSYYFFTNLIAFLGVWYSITSQCLLPEQRNFFFLITSTVSLFGASSSAYQWDSIISHSSKTTDTNIYCHFKL